jgi:hypothetical protein
MIGVMDWTRAFGSWSVILSGLSYDVVMTLHLCC